MYPNETDRVVTHDDLKAIVSYYQEKFLKREPVRFEIKFLNFYCNLYVR